MTIISLATAPDVQQQLAETVRTLRQTKKLSRRALADISTVPEATIKKFETTGQISLRQFLLLWQSVADLGSIVDLAKKAENQLNQSQPRSISDVLRS